ncbi:MAG: Mur ligase family protein, partial [Symbiobacteriaceae bacterium]|nr:Mur ligase family protein [Symbiobacteriaceae bacterium]
MRLRLALLLCRVSRFFLRLLGRGGTTVPGRIALAVYPSLLQVLAEEVTTVVVTGTNGKTTSVRMIEQGLQLAGMSHFTNRSGANLIAGITAEYVDYATWGGKPRKKYAVIECDEEALARVCHLVNPRVILLTNLFKD